MVSVQTVQTAREPKPRTPADCQPKRDTVRMTLDGLADDDDPEFSNLFLPSTIQTIELLSYDAKFVLVGYRIARRKI